MSCDQILLPIAMLTDVALPLEPLHLRGENGLAAGGRRALREEGTEHEGR